MKKYVFATNNAHKLEEVKDILGDKIELLSMKTARQTFPKRLIPWQETP